MLSSHLISAQGWSTVDDFQYVTGREANARGVAADVHGNVYVAGFATDTSGIKHGLLMRSSDQGTNWSTVLDYNYLDGTNTYFTAVGLDSAQNLYVTGAAEAQGEFGAWIQWLVLKSADHGATWSLVMDFPFYVLNDLPYYGPPYLAADITTNIYVACGTYLSTNAWVVRKSSDAGATWATVDSFPGNSTPCGIVCTSSGAFVGGTSGLVRRTVNSGKTWTTVDTYNYSMGAISADRLGNIYTAGAVQLTSGKGSNTTKTAYWTFRKGANGGTSWQTVSSNILGSGNSEITSLGTDALGSLYAAGTFGNNWLVLQSGNQGVTWSASDNLQDSTPQGFGHDLAGNLYLCGSSAGHWLVRRHQPQ